MAYGDVPVELELWSILNMNFDQAALLENQVEMDRLLPQIEEAWEAAPLRSRQVLSNTGMYRDWRDRSVGVYA